MFPLAIRCVILAAAAAGEPSAPFICATPATGAIKLDGRLDEPAWQQAVTGSDMRVLGENTAALRATTFRALTTDDALYLGIHCEAPAGRAMPKPKATDRDGPAFGDEAFELYFQPATPGPYYHLVANVTAVRYDGIGMDGSWNGEWEVRTSTVQDGWQAEVRVPFRTLGLSGKPKPGDTWRFNIARNDQVNRQYQTWAGLSAGFHEPESFGTLRFTDGPVGVGAVKLERRGRDLVLKTDAQAAATALKVEVDAALRTPAGQFQLRPSQAVPAGKVASLAATAERAWDGRAGVWLSYAVRANDQALYQPAALTIPAKLIRPVRSGEPTAITVANSEVALTFDQATGRLLAASNKLSGLDARFGDAGTPILELDTVRYISNPRFFRNEDVLTLVPDFDTLASVSKRRGDEGETLLIQHRLDPDIRVSLTVTVPKQGAETEWRIELDNRLVYQPTQALVVHRVRYPMLSDAPEAACGDQPHVITPWLMGQKF
ncbi:MAG: hypothetical protein FJ278_06875, partial [Planctomycetes bacterium]|nr:hypothetical protein [Planctomycetota bacterium]